MIFEFELQNGIRCVINKIDGIFSVSSGIAVGVGSAHETAEENGISHYIEHVNFKGTKKRSAFDISKDIDNLGAQLNAFTAKEYTCYYVKSIGEHFESAFEILADLFVDSVYDDDELKKESGVIVEEINMYDDTPDEVCTDGLFSVYYGSNGFGQTILGSIKNVKSFDRKKVLEFKKKYYTTDNIVVSIAGGVDVELAKAVCEKYLGCLEKTKKQKPPTVNLSNLCGDFYQYKKIEQAHIALAFPSVSLNDELLNAYSIISSALGGGMSSRLFQTVREKLGLAYSVYSYPSTNKECGSMVVYAGVSLKKYMDAYNAVLDVIKTLKTEGLSDTEFSRSREQMKSSFILSQESSSSQMMLIAKYLLMSNEIFSIQKKLDDINSLSLDSINGVLKNSFHIDQISTALVGKVNKPLR